MCFLLKIVIFGCYVSIPEGILSNGGEKWWWIPWYNRKQVNKSKPSKMDLVRFFKSKTNGIFGKPISPIWINNINISVASHLDLHQKKSKACQCHPSKKWLKWNSASSSARVPKKVTWPSSNMCFFFFGTETNTGWWFQPIWKILVKLEIFPE